MLKKFLRKFIVFVAVISLLTQSISPYIAFAQEVTVTDTPTPTINQTTVTPTDSPTPTDTVAPTPTDTPVPTDTPTDTLTPTPTDVPIATTTPTIDNLSPPSTDNSNQTSNSSNSSNNSTQEVQGAQTSVTPTPTTAPEQPKLDEQLNFVILKNVSAPSLNLDTVVEGSATLSTDKADYAPTDTALITGSNLLPNTSYSLTISSTDNPPTSTTVDVTSNDSGTFVYAYQLDGNYRPNYKVELKDSSGAVVATTTFTDGPPPPAPSKPDSTSTNPLSITSIQFTWKDKSSDEDDFHVERALTASGPYTEIGTVSSTTKATTGTFYTYTDSTGLTCNTSYFYRVRAHRHSDDTYSDYSKTNGDSQTTLYLSTTNVTDLTPDSAAVGTTNVPIFSFTLNSCNSGFKVKSVKVQYAGTSKNDLTNLKLYQESGSVPGAFSSGSDTLLDTVTPPGGPSNEFNLDPNPDVTVGSNSVQFYVTADISGSATNGNTVDAKILAGKIDIDPNNPAGASDNDWPFSADLGIWDPSGFITIAVADTTPPSTPTASPVAGTYSSTQSVTLLATGSDFIRYSTAGIPADCSSGILYSGAISVSSSQTISARACDTAGNSSTASFAYIIDTTAPTATSVDSDGQTYNSYTSSPQTIKATFSEDIVNTPTISVNGSGQTVTNCGDGNATTFCFNYTIPSSIDSTTETIDISGAQDAAGNTMITNNSHTFIVDTKVPTLTSVSISSNNTNPLFAKVGDEVTVTFTASEELSLPVVATIDGRDATVTNTGGNNWNAKWTMDSTDAEGLIPFQIGDFSDLAGNANAATAVTDGTSVTFDKTVPATPSATPAAGDYTSDQSVNLTSSDTNGYTIYYTTNGTTPNSSSLTTLPITVDKDMTIKGIAIDPAGNVSDMLTATYGIPPQISGEAFTRVDDNSLTVNWTTDDLSTSRVIYDTVSHSVGSAPNYGYAFSTVEDSTKVLSHSVAVSGLTTGTTYYYRVVSHGSPEAVGAEQSYTVNYIYGLPGDGHSDGRSDGGSSGGGAPAGGGVLGVATGPAYENVIGAQITPKERLGGEVLGTESANPTFENVNNPKQNQGGLIGSIFTDKGTLLFILIIAVGLFYYFYRRFKKKNN